MYDVSICPMTPSYVPCLTRWCPTTPPVWAQNVYMYIYICIYIYIYIYIYHGWMTRTCVCINVFIFDTFMHDAHMYAHMYAYMNVHMRMGLWVWMTRICVYIHAYRYTHVCAYLDAFDTCTHTCVCIHVYIHVCSSTHMHDTYMCKNICDFMHTGWRRLIGSPKLQIIFHKRANKYTSLLRKMTYKDKGSYESSPPCTRLLYVCRDSFVRDMPHSFGAHRHSVCRWNQVLMCRDAFACVMTLSYVP